MAVATKTDMPPLLSLDRSIIDGSRSQHLFTAKATYTDGSVRSVGPYASEGEAAHRLVEAIVGRSLPTPFNEDFLPLWRNVVDADRAFEVLIRFAHPGTLLAPFNRCDDQAAAVGVLHAFNDWHDCSRAVAQLDARLRQIHATGEPASMKTHPLLAMADQKHDVVACSLALYAAFLGRSDLATFSPGSSLTLSVDPRGRTPDEVNDWATAQARDWYANKADRLRCLSKCGTVLVDVGMALVASRVAA